MQMKTYNSLFHLLILKSINFMIQDFKKQTIQLCWMTAQQRLNVTLYFEQQLGPEKKKVM